MRIPFDSLAMRCVAEELDRALRGGHIQHVAQPAGMDLVVTVRTPGASRLLLLSCDSINPRAHLMLAKRANPPSPPVFCMTCRKHLEGGVVRAALQRGFDRILDLEVECADGELVTLTAELMGKHSNLILVSGSGRILDACKRIGRRLSRHREVLPGHPYAPPPAPEGAADPFSATANELAAPNAFGASLPADLEAAAARLMQAYAGMSPFLARELLVRAELSPGGLPAAWDDLIGAAGRHEWMPVLIRNESGAPLGAWPFPTVQLPPGSQHERGTLNLALEHHYSVALPRAALDSARRELAASIDRAMRAREQRRDSLLRSLEEAYRAEEYRRTGELLLANLHRAEPGMESLEVEDAYGEGRASRVITLDSRLTPQENAEAWFRRYRKARDGQKAQKEQLAETERMLAGLLAARSAVQDIRDLPGLRSLRGELESKGLLRRDPSIDGRAGEARSPDFQGRKIRTYSTPQGWDILVGENSQANDYLTGRVAQPNDLWLHVRAGTSAHVVIRTRNDPGSVPHAVLLRAAVLAARNSAQRHSQTVPVDYTLKKFVRRPRGAPSGTVLYQNEKTLHVSPKEGG